ncbi:MAG: DUF4091 domain-containing protein [Chloroflexi bacterium]|nr:DUF4091 domain-containing protein [Chloroflexota bacterium]
MDNIVCWLQSSLERVFPASPAGGAHTLGMAATRGERVSFQACVRNLGLDKLDVSVAVTGDLPILVRRVGYVPMLHHNTATPQDELDGVGHIPGYVPDPLFPEQTVIVGGLESHAFWVTVSVPPDATPGPLELSIHFECAGEPLAPLTVHLDVQPLVVPARQGFPVTHWFYADALCDWYKVEPFEEKFWQVVQPYMVDLVAHGDNCQYVPIFTPPTDGVKRPTQLLKVTEPAPGQYWFDFSDVWRWTRLARQCGAQYFEWTHLFTQWGVQHAIRVYRRNNDRNSLLWPPETGATSDTYRNFLSQFLPAFHTFLQLEGLKDKSFFHLSDEPSEQHIDNYRAARALLKELAPWMKVADALSDIHYGREGLTDIPIPVTSTAHDYAQAGLPAWVYFCCGPRGRYLNRLMDTPLPKIRMSGWLFYRLRAQGFLHWGYNYWYRSQTQQLIDPFAEQSGDAWPGWAYGDTFLVYPGADGPVDSLRWEVFGESLQDYALLQALAISPDDVLLSDLKDYDEFPKHAQWLETARQRLLS